MSKPSSNSNGWSEPTKEQIEKWKKEYTGVHRLTVKDKKGNKYIAIVRKPGITDLQRAYASNDKKPFTFGQSLFENCQLSTNPEIYKSDALLLRAHTLMAETVDVAEGEITEL